jgi:hypothetical protein
VEIKSEPWLVAPRSRDAVPIMGQRRLSKQEGRSEMSLPVTFELEGAVGSSRSDLVFQVGEGLLTHLKGTELCSESVTVVCVTESHHLPSVQSGSHERDNRGPLVPVTLGLKHC